MSTPDSPQTTGPTGPTDPAAPANPGTPTDPADPTSPGPRLSWSEWHAAREDDLRAPHGWLSLTSLTWLDATPTGVPDFPASWTATPVDEGDTPGTFRVEFTPGQGVDFTRDGVPVEGTQEWVLGPGEQDTSLSTGDLVAEVARRGDGVCVRVRDPHAPTLSHFSGVPTWEFNPAWVRPATLTRLPVPEPRVVPSAQPGRTTTLTVAGRVHVSLPDGSATDLDVVGEDEDSWGVVFHDPTNGEETSGWRRAPVTPTGEATAEVDFNRSVNFPAHFSPFGTCPTPIEGNTVPVPVRAGEKKPTMPSS